MSARQVRRSLSWAVSGVAVFVLVITVVGSGATALIGRAVIAGADPQGNTAHLLGSRAAFGADVSTAETLLFTTVTTAVFLTVLASVAGMILACANSLAHDVFAARARATSPRHAAFPEADFTWFPFTTTGIVTIPLGFALGWLGTPTSGRRGAEEQRRQYEAVEGGILAGAVRRKN